ncbi:MULTISPECIES: DNA polymerase III subunit beta [unclassified Mesorhizobium]|uniref:DNA polymerase III subunit beta n=1 Tax=unclassified Mesorhizobium TaxID=325217 RepID=UPI000AB8BB42|nr:MULTISPECIES: DNA polymerase III subunit beta [unclassified Mesorhizobium]MBN9255245.1 DNA polymerase III subunit beta [Mesorhizobium sp.]
MRMQASAGQLRAALGAFRGIVQRRNTVPVLGTVKFQDGHLVGTDLDAELSVKIASIGPMAGASAIDLFALSSLAANIDEDEELTISDEDGTATIGFNGSSYRLGSLPVEDFPTFGQPIGPRTMTGNLGLVAAMNRIRFAMSTEETRYYLNGVAILHDSEGKALLVATSGHQLAMMPLDFAPEGSVNAIIPRSIVHYLCQRKMEPEACVFDLERQRARFDFAGQSLATKLIDGKFPDIFRVIPQDAPKLFTADRKALLRRLVRIRSFSEAFFRGVALELAGDVLTLKLKTGDRTATETLAVNGRGGQAEAGFNADYLITILNGLRGEHVTFASPAPFASNPTVITSDGDPLTVLQMPMRV